MRSSGLNQYRVEKEIGGQRFLFVRKWSRWDKQYQAEVFKFDAKNPIMRWTYWGTFPTVREATAVVVRRAKDGEFER